MTAMSQNPREHLIAIRDGTDPFGNQPCIMANITQVNNAYHAAAAMANDEVVDATRLAVATAIRTFVCEKTDPSGATHYPPTIREYAIAISQSIASEVV